MNILVIAVVVIIVATCLVVSQPRRTEESPIEYLSNDIDSVGFPESQILPYCNGDAYLCGELSAIYHFGQEFPITGNARLDGICQRLTRMSGYGLFAHLNN